jgi:hypothetical protein
MAEMENIIKANAEQTKHTFYQRERFLEFVAQYRRMSGLDGDDDEGGENENRRAVQCVHQ